MKRDRAKKETQGPAVNSAFLLGAPSEGCSCGPRARAGVGPEARLPASLCAEDSNLPWLRAQQPSALPWLLAPGPGGVWGKAQIRGREKLGRTAGEATPPPWRGRAFRRGGGGRGERQPCSRPRTSCRHCLATVCGGLPVLCPSMSRAPGACQHVTSSEAIPQPRFLLCHGGEGLVLPSRGCQLGDWEMSPTKGCRPKACTGACAARPLGAWVGRALVRPGGADTRRD